MKNKISNLWILCAFAWFGHACGSSFATGRLAVQYCSRHGAKGIWGAIAIYVMTAIWMFIALEYGRMVHSKNYKDIVKGIYWDNKIVGSVMLVVWDLIQLFSIIVVSASCIAGSGTVLNSALGINYTLGMIIFVVIMLVLFLAGPNVFKKLGKMSIPMFVLLMIICVVSILVGWDNLTVTLAGGNDTALVEGTGTNSAVMKDAFTYACTQLGFIGTGSIYAGQFESRKDTFRAVGLGMILCGGGLAVCTVATLTTFPACIDQAVPFLEIINTLKGSGRLLYVVYVVMLFVAYMSTAGSLVLSGVSRYTPVLGKVIKNNVVCKIILVVVFLLAGTLIGKLGLMEIVNKGYGMLGKLRMPTWYIPVLILGPVAIYRLAKKQKQQENCE